MSAKIIIMQQTEPIIHNSVHFVHYQSLKFERKDGYIISKDEDEQEQSNN